MFDLWQYPNELNSEARSVDRLFSQLAKEDRLWDFFIYLHGAKQFFLSDTVIQSIVNNLSQLKKDTMVSITIMPPGNGLDALRKAENLFKIALTLDFLVNLDCSFISLTEEYAVILREFFSKNKTLSKLSLKLSSVALIIIVDALSQHPTLEEVSYDIDSPPMILKEGGSSQTMYPGNSCIISKIAKQIKKSAVLRHMVVTTNKSKIYEEEHSLWDLRESLLKTKCRLEKLALSGGFEFDKKSAEILTDIIYRHAFLTELNLSEVSIPPETVPQFLLSVIASKISEFDVAATNRHQNIFFSDAGIATLTRFLPKNRLLNICVHARNQLNPDAVKKALSVHRGLSLTVWDEDDSSRLEKYYPTNEENIAKKVVQQHNIARVTVLLALCMANPSSLALCSNISPLILCITKLAGLPNLDVINEEDIENLARAKNRINLDKFIDTRFFQSFFNAHVNPHFNSQKRKRESEHDLEQISTTSLLPRAMS